MKDQTSKETGCVMEEETKAEKKSESPSQETGKPERLSKDTEEPSKSPSKEDETSKRVSKDNKTTESKDESATNKERKSKGPSKKERRMRKTRIDHKWIKTQPRGFYTFGGRTLYWTGRTVQCIHRRNGATCVDCHPERACAHGKACCKVCRPRKLPRNRPVFKPSSARWCPHGRDRIDSCGLCDRRCHCEHALMWYDCEVCCPDRTTCKHGYKSCRYHICRRYDNQGRIIKPVDVNVTINGWTKHGNVNPCQLTILPTVTLGDNPVYVGPQTRPTRKPGQCKVKEQSTVSKMEQINVNEIKTTSCYLLSHERDKRIRLDDRTHVYYVDNKPRSLSVSGLVKKYFPVFPAKSIASNMARSYTPKVGYDTCYFDSDGTRLPLDVITDRILTKWRSSALESAKYGTLVHKYAEDMSYCLVGKRTYKPERLQDDIRNLCSVVDEWFETSPLLEGVVGLRPEWSVFNDYVCGQVDLVVQKKNGTFILIDFKTCKDDLRLCTRRGEGLHPFEFLADTKLNHYIVQLNTYKHLLHTVDVNCTRAYIVQFLPGKYVEIQVDREDVMNAVASVFLCPSCLA